MSSRARPAVGSSSSRNFWRDAIVVTIQAVAGDHRTDPRPGVRRPVQPALIEKMPDPCFMFVPSRTAAQKLQTPHIQRECRADIVGDGEIWKIGAYLKRSGEPEPGKTVRRDRRHVRTIEMNLAGSWLRKAADHVEQRGLACPVRPDHRMDRPCVEIDRAPRSASNAEANCQVARGQQRCCSAFTPTAEAIGAATRCG